MESNAMLQVVLVGSDTLSTASTPAPSPPLPLTPMPQVVLIDSDTLSTLPNRELASGISEIIKYGLIR